ncbi:hypothetical protein AVEN_87978-1 [Araneus ventricosus]|uniref:Uncharacterized protein n=1 Tax=Araneus ventricosus TaxID=182803 RepID=A0A4Y2U601_ARAVE|nr:hypothetical protein AVEN_97968-1 [Araneus ventricosus]GBO07938.1 hypothetical protein AVEN_212146-1 [Araneus ventricosus]GBO39491.1 hypothetical protein AVEN_85512-1 [Araneus ventricosus]GBO39493.1 hypothetical protein AVEN_87978-1 [Araneus ventricosus]
MRGKGRPSPQHNFLSSFHFTKPSAENTLLWWKNLLLNKLLGIKIAKLISFLNENENLKNSNWTQPVPSDPIFFPSPRLKLMDPDPLEVQYQEP